MTITLELYYARFGALVRPYKETVGFDYNRVYNNFDEIIQDFALNGWKLIDKQDSDYGNEVVSSFCTFQQGE